MPTPRRIDLARLVADVRAIVDALCVRLQVDRLDILVFSLGATLATLAAAQNPARIGHVVAVGIDVDFAESERYAYVFACNEATRRGDRRAQRQLQAIGAPPHDTSKRFLTRVRWVTAYGGIDRGRGFIGLLWANVWGLLASPHYSIPEVVEALRAIERTQGRMLAHLQHSICGRSSHGSKSQSCSSKVDTTSRPRPSWWPDMSTRSMPPVASHSCGSKPAPTCLTTKSPRASTRLCSARSNSTRSQREEAPFPGR